MTGFTAYASFAVFDCEFDPANRQIRNPSIRQSVNPQSVNPQSTIRNPQ
jgi:hypothetical protein